jgi:excisionase family DNA binding protein
MTDDPYKLTAAEGLLIKKLVQGPLLEALQNRPLTVRQAARVCMFSTKTIRRLIKKGVLPYHRLPSGTIKIYLKDVLKLMGQEHLLLK